jgi:hypothetical protein
VWKLTQQPASAVRSRSSPQPPPGGSGPWQPTCVLGLRLLWLPLGSYMLRPASLTCGCGRGNRGTPSPFSRCAQTQFTLPTSPFSLPNAPRVCSQLVFREKMNPLGLDAARFVVAEDHSGVVSGVGQLKPLPGAGLLELASLVVTSQHRGQGVGRCATPSYLPR